MNRRALESIPAEKRLAAVLGATHLFEEPGTLEEVARLAVDWFRVTSAETMALADAVQPLDYGPLLERGVGTRFVLVGRPRTARTSSTGSGRRSRSG